jgi:hypothetical protein
MNRILKISGGADASSARAGSPDEASGAPFALTEEKGRLYEHDDR